MLLLMLLLGSGGGGGDDADAEYEEFLTGDDWRDDIRYKKVKNLTIPPTHPPTHTTHYFPLVSNEWEIYQVLNGI